MIGTEVDNSPEAKALRTVVKQCDAVRDHYSAFKTRVRELADGHELAGGSFVADQPGFGIAYSWATLRFLWKLTKGDPVSGNLLVYREVYGVELEPQWRLVREVPFTHEGKVPLMKNGEPLHIVDFDFIVPLLTELIPDAP